MERRDSLDAAGTAADGPSTADCLEFGGGGASGSRTVATYDSSPGDSGTAGCWLNESKQVDHHVEVEYRALNAASNEIIQRKQSVASIDADRYVGLNTPEPATFTYEGLAGNVEEWTEAWAQQGAAN